ncbi:MAG: hypothetical protein EXR85_03620 [Xanthomonadales bacterium]|nr:hypothetical protein [Xanthomonadales bacterium]
MGAAPVLQWLLLDFAIVVPLRFIYTIFHIRSTSEEAVFWGIAFVYLSACLPLVLFPTLALLTPAETAADERARDFCQRLITPC